MRRPYYATVLSGRLLKNEVFGHIYARVDRGQYHIEAWPIRSFTINLYSVECLVKWIVQQQTALQKLIALFLYPAWVLSRLAWSFRTSLAATRTPKTNCFIPYFVWVSSGLAWSLWIGLGGC